MSELPTEWSALCVLCVLMGVRHGLDADHLAAVDGLTRYNTGRARPFARWCGLYFSTGHSVVMLVVATAVVGARVVWSNPSWLQPAGEWLSIACLILVGALNLRAVLWAAPGDSVRFTGVRGRYLGGLTRAGQPLLVVAVGAVFAVSLDTLGQAAWLGLAASRYGGATQAALLALLFGTGMIVVNAAHGWWVARLLQRADQLAAIATRVMGYTIAIISLSLATGGVIRRVHPEEYPWLGWTGAGAALITAVLAGCYCVARQRAGVQSAPAANGAACASDAGAVAGAGAPTRE